MFNLYFSLFESMTIQYVQSNEAFEWDGSSSTGRRDRSQEERSRSESFHDHFRRGTPYLLLL